MRRSFVSSFLLPALLLPAAAIASTPTPEASSVTRTVRVSTGVIAPTVIYSIPVVPPSNSIAAALPINTQVGLKVTVDKNGMAENIRVVNSLTPEWDASVVAAVRQFRFRPAQLDNQVIPMDIHLLVNILR
jgi:TonB family protein